MCYDCFRTVLMYLKPYKKFISSFFKYQSYYENHEGYEWQK